MLTMGDGLKTQEPCSKKAATESDKHSRMLGNRSREVYTGLDKKGDRQPIQIVPQLTILRHGHEQALKRVSQQTVVEGQVSLRCQRMDTQPNPLRIAYLISAYRDPDHLQRLVEALQGEGTDFYVHVDSKVNMTPFREKLDGKAVFVPRHWVNWGGWSQVEYQRELLQAAVDSGKKYDRVVCLSGQDYPLWSRERIEAHYLSHPNTELIMGENLTQSPNRSLQTRISCYHYFRDLKWRSTWWRNKIIVATRLLMRLLPLHKPLTAPLGGRRVEVYCGSDYWSLTMACARHVLHVLSTDTALVRYFRHSFVPSEMCVQTIVFASPFGQHVIPYDGRKGLYHLSPLHYLVYGKSIKILTLADLPAIVQANKMMCRKVVTGWSNTLVGAIKEQWTSQAVDGDAIAASAGSGNRAVDLGLHGNGSLSIVLCTCNGARYLRPQLDSLFAQTLPADEIVVQDDCSTDDTCAIVEEYARLHPCIHLFRNAERMGINANFFSALSRATGDYIALCDQDDIWLPDKLQRQMQAIGTRLLCAGQSRSFASDAPDLRIETDLRAPNLHLLRLVYLAAFAGHTILMHRTLLQLLPDMSRFAEVRMYDLILAQVAAAYDSIAMIDDVLVMHRRFTGAATYTAPTDRRLTPANVLDYLTRTLRLHHLLRPLIAQRMQATHTFLLSIASPEPARRDALRLTALQSCTGLRYALAFPRLMAFCVRHAGQLFHARVEGRPSLMLRLRALYFPISCSEYFRHLLPRQHS